MRDNNKPDEEDESDSEGSDSNGEGPEDPNNPSKIGSSPPSGKAERDLIIDEPDVTTSPVQNVFS